MRPFNYLNGDHIKLLSPLYGREGEDAEILFNGIRIKRKIRYSRYDGLYITVNGKKYFEYELPLGEEVII